MVPIYEVVKKTVMFARMVRQSWIYEPPDGM